jgi:hypothetical protein
VVSVMCLRRSVCDVVRCRGPLTLFRSRSLSLSLAHSRSHSLSLSLRCRGPLTTSLRFFFGVVYTQIHFPYVYVDTYAMSIHTYHTYNIYVYVNYIYIHSCIYEIYVCIFVFI